MNKSSDWPLLDVRSPVEFAQGHIPGAISFPLFSDDERARVGTLFKQQGEQEALLEGLRIVGPKMAGMVEHALYLAPEKKIRVHCWRGGMRSNSVAWLLRTAGFTVEVLAGGYKAYRQKVHLDFHGPFRFVMLSGKTGSGKTEVLQALRTIGEQVVDLEQLASHRGSAFGALGMQVQPSIEHFENELHRTLLSFDSSRCIWVEDESRKIGTVVLHESLWAQMQRAPCIVIDAPDNERIDRLVRDYGQFPTEQLEAALLKIAKRLGGQNYKAAQEALHEQSLHIVAEISLKYYDKTYAYSFSRQHEGRSVLHQSTLESPEETAKALISICKALAW